MRPFIGGGASRLRVCGKSGRRDKDEKAKRKENRDARFS
jgi:hypothetical protein